MNGFNIKKAPSEFMIQEDSLKSFFSQQERTEHMEIPSEKQSEGEVSTLYILPSAFAELNSHINWKARTSTNLSEQGGILVGCVYKDKNSQLVCGVVKHIIPSAKSGDATYIQFTHDNWISMYREFEEKYSTSLGDAYSLHVIGWYHTHPDMPVNMSGIDKQTHISFFPDIHQFSVIINPQRGIWAVFNGSECKNCNGFLYCDKGYETPEIGIEDPSITSYVNENSNSSSFGSFVIKRLPNSITPQSNTRQASPDTTVVQRTPEYHQNINIRGVSRCRGHSEVYRGRTYYFPFHETYNAKSYLISNEFVGKVRRALDVWSFSNNEAVSLSYLVRTPCQCLFQDNQRGIGYYSICDDNGMSAQGFVCEKNHAEYLSFHNTVSGYSQGVLVNVLFSETLPDYRTICKKYCDYDCLLWFNAKDTSEFLFFCIEKRVSAIQAPQNFNIKNLPQTENYIGGSLVLFGREIYENLLNTLFSAMSSYVMTETDETLYQKDEYRLSTQILQKAFEKIKRYGKFTQPFSIAVGYSTLVAADRTFSAPQMNKFGNLWFFLGNGRSASFKNLDDDCGATKCAKFAFVISNYDVNIDSIRSKLFGYTTAFCFNIETQDYRFYRLF